MMPHGRSRFIPAWVVDIHAQRAHMRLRWPEFRSEVCGGVLRCWGMVRPTPLSARYDALIEMHNGAFPNVFIQAPELLPLVEGGSVPHTYAPNHLCMYHPTEWAPHRLIAITIVPWTYRWLFVYENWRVTGAWDAYGVHPTSTHRPSGASVLLAAA